MKLKVKKWGQITPTLAILVIAIAVWFTPLAVYANPGISAPTDFNATDMGAISVNLTWSKGAGANNTTIICRREIAPANITDGELVYAGNLTNFIHPGLALETTRYYYKAWGGPEPGDGYSATYTETEVGGMGMEAVATSIASLSSNIELIATMLFSLVILGLALWRRAGFMYLMAAPVTIAFGWYWAGEHNIVAGIAFAAVGGYCFYLAIRAFISARG